MKKYKNKELYLALKKILSSVNIEKDINCKFTKIEKEKIKIAKSK